MQLNSSVASFKGLESITIIDDNQVDLFISSKALERAGVRCLVNTFSGGMEALDFFRDKAKQPMPPCSQAHEIIFLDINMPIMNGFEFLDQMHEMEYYKTHSFVVFFLSSSMAVHDMEKIKKYEEHCLFIPKPLSVEKALMALMTPFMRDAG
jgi:CheY-like chemotaxis protein